jgi:hypothetical protein
MTQRTRLSSTERRNALRDELKIDQANLDVELVQHPQLLFEAATGYAMALSNRDSAKDEMKAVEGRVAVRLRGSLSKTTEKAIDHAISTDSEYETARAKYQSACNECEQWLALKEAFVARGFALHNLAAIYTARMAAEGNSSYNISAQRRER